MDPSSRIRLVSPRMLQVIYFSFICLPPPIRFLLDDQKQYFVLCHLVIDSHDLARVFLCNFFRAGESFSFVLINLENQSVGYWTFFRVCVVPSFIVSGMPTDPLICFLLQCRCKVFGRSFFFDFSNDAI